MAPARGRPKSRCGDFGAGSIDCGVAILGSDWVGINKEHHTGSAPNHRALRRSPVKRPRSSRRPHRLRNLRLASWLRRTGGGLEPGSGLPHILRAQSPVAPLYQLMTAASALSGERLGYDAREKGLDDVDQTGHAVRAVLAARPDMTASDAMWQVERLR